MMFIEFAQFSPVGSLNRIELIDLIELIELIEQIELIELTRIPSPRTNARACEGTCNDSDWKPLIFKHKPNLPRARMQRFYQEFQLITMISKYTASCVCKIASKINVLFPKTTPLDLSLRPLSRPVPAIFVFNKQWFFKCYEKPVPGVGCPASLARDNTSHR